MSLLAVYIYLLSRWCNRIDVVISVPARGHRYQGIENTIGTFGTALFLRVKISQDENFQNLLARVTDEYIAAYEHDNCGNFETTLQTSEFLSNPCFNFFSKDYSMLPIPKWSDAAPPGDSLQELPFELNMEPINEWGFVEPVLMMFEGQDHMAGTLIYRSDLAAETSVERFVENIPRFARLLTDDSRTPFGALHKSDDKLHR